jgi:hypothetical protein
MRKNKRYMQRIRPPLVPVNVATSVSSSVVSWGEWNDGDTVTVKHQGHGHLVAAFHSHPRPRLRTYIIILFSRPLITNLDPWIQVLFHPLHKMSGMGTCGRQWMRREDRIGHSAMHDAGLRPETSHALQHGPV